MNTTPHAIPLFLLFSAFAACTTTIDAPADSTNLDADGGSSTDDDGGSSTSDGGKKADAAPTGTATWKLVTGVSDDILSMWGSNASDVWYTTSASQIFHYDGKSWTLFASGGPALSTIWGTSATNVYAAGVGTFVHYDGTGWTDVAPQVTTGTINAIGGNGANDVWVVGQYIGSANLRHFDGNAWDFGDTHNPPAASANVVLRAVTGGWVVGDSGTLLHWNGGSWDSAGESFGSTLYGAWGVSDAYSWFVGGANTVMASVGGQVQIESDHLVGAFPLSNTASEALYGVWGPSSASVWAVGSKGHIIHRDSNATWTLASSPTTTDLHCIWGSGANDVWAGGSGVLLHYSLAK